jgi:polyisoprenyl-phosphate glycosyltransferase
MTPSYAICIPIYNDWESARLLVKQLHTLAQSQTHHFNVVLVDDGSSQAPPELLTSFPSSPKVNVRIVRLRSNLGHQRAIAVGLAYIHRCIPCQGVVVMDGDGEDRPEDVFKLIDCAEREQLTKAVFARRIKRTESLVFRIFYFLYRVVHFFLIGKKVEVGNFSCLPHAHLGRLMVVSEIWNHYAAAVVKARFPRVLSPIARGHRLDGKSKMNFVSLVMHGLSAISVFSDEVLAISSLATVGVVIIDISGSSLGWLLSDFVVLVTLLLASLFLTLVFALLILHGRHQSTFILLRDGELFILETIEANHG